jgi:hypothetical protein
LNINFYKIIIPRILIGYGALDNVAVDEVFAFRKDSIITNYMAGDNLKPLNAKLSFWKELYNSFFNCNNKSFCGSEEKKYFPIKTVYSFPNKFINSNNTYEDNCPPAELPERGLIPRVKKYFSRKN